MESWFYYIANIETSPQVCLLCYTIFVTVAAQYGFGQSASDLATSDLANSILFEAIGQTFAVIGMAVAKWSLGVFLLRIIHLRTHKALVWTVMGLLVGASISACFVFWLQCTPTAYLWDRSIPGGFCQLDSTPVSLLFCGKTTDCGHTFDSPSTDTSQFSVF